MKTGMIDYDILIVKYLDNTISSSEKQELEEWLRNSKSNQRYFKESSKIWEESVIAFQDKETTMVGLDRFYKKLKIQQKYNRLKWFIGFAAAVILGVVVVRYLMPLFQPEVTLIEIATTDIKKQIELPDGSIVWLNSNSSLKYPSSFKQTREVSLTGEGLFEIEKKANKSFYVHTTNLSVEVLGTKFLVSAHDEQSFTETVLESGSIALNVKGLDKEIKMIPNQKFNYDNILGTTSIETVDATNYTSWSHKKLVVDNTPLREVFIQLEKWYNIKIVCNDKRLLSQSVSFTLDDEPLEEVFEILQHLYLFTWSYQYETITIKSQN